MATLNDFSNWSDFILEFSSTLDNVAKGLTSRRPKDIMQGCCFPTTHSGVSSTDKRGRSTLMKLCLASVFAGCREKAPRFK